MGDDWEHSLEDLQERDRDRLEPGSPNLEHVAFVVLGILAAIISLSQMFAFL